MNLELNIALMPNAELAAKLVAVSEVLAARHDTIVRLGTAGPRLTLAPHLTLYQVALSLGRVSQAGECLAKLAGQTPRLTLAATEYAYNADEASFEVRREIPDSLVALQNAVIQALHRLRNGLLLERDPAGNSLAELVQQAGPIGDNIRQTGYAEVGGLFRPHDTTNWFTLGAELNVDSEPLPSLDTLTGQYEAIGIFALGPHGTCPQLMAKHYLRHDAA